MHCGGRQRNFSQKFICFEAPLVPNRWRKRYLYIPKGLVGEYVVSVGLSKNSWSLFTQRDSVEQFLFLQMMFCSNFTLHLKQVVNIMLHYKIKFLINTHHLGEQLELINSSLEAEDLAAFCLDLAWRAAANEDFRACNLSNYVQDVEKQVSVDFKNMTYTTKNTPFSVLSSLSCQREKSYISLKGPMKEIQESDLISSSFVKLNLPLRIFFWFEGSWGLMYWESARGVLDIFSSFWQP